MQYLPRTEINRYQSKSKIQDIFSIKAFENRLSNAKAARNKQKVRYSFM